MSEPSNNDPVASSDQAKAHYTWRQHIGKYLPELATRTFALRGKFYRGCGFHYGLERALGRVIAMVNDYNTAIKMTDLLIDEITVECFTRSLIEAELSAKGVNFVDEAVKRSAVSAIRNAEDMYMTMPTSEG